jgi:diguanylate cyclase (GGDEF)-like protein
MGLFKLLRERFIESANKKKIILKFKDDYIKLNKKILVIFSIITCLMLVIVYLISYNLFLSSFYKLEEMDAVRQSRQVIGALEQNLLQLKALNQDYAAWDATYEFIIDRNLEYIDENLMNETFYTNNWSIFILVNEQGKIIYKKAVNLKNKEEVIVDKEILEDLKEGSPLFDFSKPTDNITGIISTSQGYMMVSSHPVTTGYFKGPIRGSLIIGRYLNQGLINQLAEQTNLAVTMETFKQRQAGKEMESLDSDLIGKVDIWLKDIDDTYMSGYSTLYDIYNRPALTLKISKVKDIYHQGYLSMLYFMGGILIVGVIYFISTWSFMNKFIFNPLQLLIEGINDVSKNRDLSTRLTIGSKGEFSTIKVKFNNMLDILEKSHKKILHQSRHDELTNLPNRSYFYEQISEQLSLTKGDEINAVFFIDIDKFKSINDSFGHEIGDLLLQAISKRLEENLPEGSISSRIGGDEFIIFIPKIKDKKFAEDVAKKIISSIKVPYYINGKELIITLSIGISLYPIDGTDIDFLINNADLAMYNVKNRGKNDFEFYNINMRNKLSKEMLVKALKEDELELYYQPKVNGLTGDITGMESLLRWNHPEKGFISPVEFIPIAEETGLIISIGEWVLKKACEQTKRWNLMTNSTLVIAVNISNIQFRKVDFIEMIKRVLKESGLNPKYLELEITESVAVNNEEEVIKKLIMLKRLGVSVAIDDFGTGYSSLSYLQKLPIDTLKIDKVFVDDIVKDDTIAKMIINMAKNLEISVIAEGVEREDQLNQLLKLGCESIQGYLFSKPLSTEKFEELLIKEQQIKINQ